MINIAKLMDQFPIYKEHYASIDPTHTSLSDLPDLDKKNVISQFPRIWTNSILESAIAQNQVEFMMTSGTTGERMQLVRKKNWWREEYQRIGYVHPLLGNLYHHNKNKAVLTTAICSNTVCFRDNPTLDKRIVGSTLYLNYAHDISLLSRDDVVRMINEYNDFAPYNLDADPIYLSILLKLRIKYGITEPLHQPAFISLSYEFCPENCYAYIKQCFPVPIMRMYGSTELGYLYYSLDKQAYQLFSDFVQPKFIAYPGIDNAFELVMTSLKNEFMPFINYKTGDLVSIDQHSEEEIASNPAGIQLSHILGRVKDVISLANGKHITVNELDQLVSQFSSILYYQAELDDNYLLFYYATIDDNDLSQNDRLKLDALLSNLFMRKAQLHLSQFISPSASGKYLLIRALHNV